MDRKGLFLSFLIAVVVVSQSVVGCASSAPPPTPTKASVAPTKAAELTEPVEPAKVAEPTKASVTSPTNMAAPAQPPVVSVFKKVDWPEKGKTITIIVPFGAGAADFQAWIIAVFLEKELGVAVQIVNKPGAAVQTGLTELVKSKPDGYSVGLSPLPTTYYTYLDPERKAAFGRKDLVQVANQVVNPQAVGVSDDSPYKSLKELLYAAKVQQGQFKAATAGLLGNDHLGILLLEQTAGVEFNSVHFDGGGAAVTALLGGHVDVGFQTIGAFAPSVKSKFA